MFPFVLVVISKFTSTDALIIDGFIFNYLTFLKIHIIVSYYAVVGRADFLYVFAVGTTWSPLLPAVEWKSVPVGT